MTWLNAVVHARYSIVGMPSILTCSMPLVNLGGYPWHGHNVGPLSLGVTGDPKYHHSSPALVSIGG